VIRVGSLATLLLALGACSHDGTADHPPPPIVDVASPCGIERPVLWGQALLPSQYRFAGQRVGGLSGIDYRPRAKDYLLISDDRGAHGGAHVYRASLSFGAAGKMEIAIEAAITLRQADGSPFAADGAIGTGTDAEALRAAGNDHLFWANEAKGAESQGPQVFEAKLPGGESTPLALSRDLDPAGDRSRGPRDNRSFEGLSIDPDGVLWLGVEAPLIEDDDPPSVASGGWTRIVRLAWDGEGSRDYLYPLEPIARQLPGRLADNGLSELIALRGPAFLVLERSGSQQQDGGFEYVTRIFCAYPGQRENVSEPVRLNKHLVVELSQLGPFDNANFEGMTFGPRLPDGRRSLILVADNDFRDERPNIFIALAFR
jgi:hypothetical protein